MLENYGPGTHVLCRGCGLKIFVTAAKVIDNDGRRLIGVECKRPHCTFYGQLVAYDEQAFEIHGLLHM